MFFWLPYHDETTEQLEALIVEHGGMIVNTVECYTFQIKLLDDNLDFDRYYEKAPIICETYIWECVRKRKKVYIKRYFLTEGTDWKIFHGELVEDLGMPKVARKMRQVVSSMDKMHTLRDLPLHYKSFVYLQGYYAT